MKIYSIDNTKRDEKQDNLYDLFYPMLTGGENIKMGEYVVRDAREMRMDLICTDIFGSSIYVDELMFINKIIDPYSVKNGDIIYYPLNKQLIENVRRQYESDKDISANKAGLKNSSGEVTTSRPSHNYNPVTLDTNNKEISIINKLG